MITAEPVDNLSRQTNFKLVLRMARFIGHVRRTALIACVLVALWVWIEVSAIRLTGAVTTRVEESLKAGKIVPPGVTFWQALHQAPLDGIVQMIIMLGI